MIKHEYNRQNMHGNILLLSITFALLLLICVLGIIQVGCLIVFQHNSQSATEAAALACAKDLSRIVIEDPHFGFVSITDQAPGSRTVSSYGEPLSVRGINTILASIREARILSQRNWQSTNDASY